MGEAGVWQNASHCCNYDSKNNKQLQRWVYYIGTVSSQQMQSYWIMLNNNTKRTPYNEHVKIHHSQTLTYSAWQSMTYICSIGDIQLGAECTKYHQWCIEHYYKVEMSFHSIVCKSLLNNTCCTSDRRTLKAHTYTYTYTDIRYTEP